MSSITTAAGIAALKAGDKAQARALLLQAVKDDPSDELAWLWLSGAVELDEQRRMALERVLALNPANEGARKGLALLPPSPPPPLSPMADVPYSALVLQREAASASPPSPQQTQTRLQAQDEAKPSGNFAAKILMTIIFIGAFGWFLMSLASNGAEQLHRERPQSVTYRVTGVVTVSAGLTYRNAAGNTNQKERASLPWELTFSGVSGQFAYVSAQNNMEIGSVKCQIILNGTVVQEAIGDGAYQIATCSGTIP